MQEFMEIMSLMNYGLNNESTLKDTIPKIVKLGLSINPENINGVMDWMMEEECLTNPHPGLNSVITACKQVVPNVVTNSRVR